MLAGWQQEDNCNYYGSPVHVVGVGLTDCECELFVFSPAIIYESLEVIASLLPVECDKVSMKSEQRYKKKKNVYKKPKVACNAKPKRNRNELELTSELPASMFWPKVKDKFCKQKQSKYHFKCFLFYLFFVCRLLCIRVGQRCAWAIPSHLLPFLLAKKVKFIV